MYDRHCTAKTALITLKDCWGDVTNGLHELRMETITPDIFVSQCQILLQTIRQAIQSEKEEGLISEIKTAAMQERNNSIIF